MARQRSTPSITREDVSGLTAEKKSQDAEAKPTEVQANEAHQEALDKGYVGQDAAELAEAEDKDNA